MLQAFNNNRDSFNIANSFNHTLVTNDESKILTWLSPLEPRVRHRDIVARRVESIGAWLLETKEFRGWRRGCREDESSRATLFCDGNPGAGKSYIISLVIDKLCDEADEENAAVVCFYFDFATRSEQSPVNMLGSLLRQLVSGLEEIPEVVIRSFRKEKKVIGGRGLQVSDILGMLQTITSRKRTFICVDALDECVPGNRMVVLESLGQILESSPSTRVFMTGRSHVRSDVERKLGGVATFISIRATEDSLVRYLGERLKNDTSPEIMSDALQADIMKIIPDISSETFLLASLHIEAILRETTIARREKRLKSVKDGTGLDDAYGVTLERIKCQGGEKTRLAISTLTWICYAERPLEVDELCHALAVEIGTENFDPKNVPLIGTLLGCCQGLITVDREASTVRLIHFTVQEYLCAQPDLFDKPHSIIAEACLTYLCSQQVKNLPAHPLPNHENMPFLKYSSRYWGTHAKQDLTDHARALALELLLHNEDHVSAASLLKQVLPDCCLKHIETPLFSGLHYASYFGIVELVTELTDTKSCGINQQDCAGRTPLLWAAENGNEVVVGVLVGRQDADPNLGDLHDRSSLGHAAMMGHEGVVTLLLGRDDVDPDRVDDQDSTPLLWAAHNGHGGIVKLLLDRKDVSPDRPDNQDSTALFWAARNGHEGIASLLVDRKDVNPNRPGQHDRTPLGCAAVGGHEGVVKLLLERENVDPNHPDEKDRTPLGCAAIEGHEGVVKLLLERENVDPDRPDNQDSTPLSWAANGGHEGIVKLLLDRKDVDPNRPGVNGRTPLGCAAIKGHEGVVKLLLERENVCPNRPDETTQTLLECTTSEAPEGAVKPLLGPGGVEPNHPNENDPTTHGCAALDGQEGVAQLLAERNNFRPDRPERSDRTLLERAASAGPQGVVQPLPEPENFNPNGLNYNDGTLLARVPLVGRVVELVLERENFNPTPRHAGYQTQRFCVLL